MYRREREQLAKAIVTNHVRCAYPTLKSTVNHFESREIPRRTVYIIINKQLKALVQTVDNRTGASQRRLGRLFGVYHTTISRVLKIERQ